MVASKLQFQFHHGESKLNTNDNGYKLPLALFLSGKSKLVSAAV